MCVGAGGSGNSSSSVIVTAIVAPRRQVCREGCSSARVGSTTPPAPLSHPLLPHRLLACKAAVVWGSPPPPPSPPPPSPPRHHTLPSLIPLQQPRSVSRRCREPVRGLRGVWGGGGGMGEGRGQGRRKEVVQWNSGTMRLNARLVDTVLSWW